MLMPPTTTVTISRGTSTDGYGDVVEVADQLYTDVPAIIAYNSGVAKDPASGRPVQVSAYEAILDNGTDIRPQDRVTDQQTGEVYEVTSVRRLPSYGLPVDVQVAMWRIDGQ